MLKELGEKTVTFPTRWALGKLTDFETVIEIENLSSIVVSGCQAITGVYMRLCNTIRESSLPEQAIKEALAQHFPQPRVSEIMRVAGAPHSVYMRYSAGFFGFKAALKQCRLYNVTPSQELTRRQIKRAASRLVDLMGQGSVRVHDKTITVK